MDSIVMKNIFCYVLRDIMANRVQDFMAISLTCKQWNMIINLQVNEADTVKYDKFMKQRLNAADTVKYDILMKFRLNVAQTYNRVVQWYYQLETQMKYYHRRPMNITGLIPIDHCIYCGKLRDIFDDYMWCDNMGGCHKWRCSEHIDKHEITCHPIERSPFMPREKWVQDRAYFIYLNTGKDDPIANYYEAVNYYLKNFRLLGLAIPCSFYGKRVF